MGRWVMIDRCNWSEYDWWTIESWLTGVIDQIMMISYMIQLRTKFDVKMTKIVAESHREFESSITLLVSVTQHFKPP